MTRARRPVWVMEIHLPRRRQDDRPGREQLGKSVPLMTMLSPPGQWLFTKEIPSQKRIMTSRPLLSPHFRMERRRDSESPPTGFASPVTASRQMRTPSPSGHRLESHLPRFFKTGGRPIRHGGSWVERVTGTCLTQNPFGQILVRSE